MDQFWLQNGRSFAVRSAPGSIPDPQVDSKGRLDPIWEHSGTILGAFLTIFCSILTKILKKFLIKTILLQVYLHTSVAPISLTCVPASALRFRGRRNGVSLLDIWLLEFAPGCGFGGACLR